MLHLNRVFVTVGTTLFVELIETVTSNEVLALLANYHCKQLVLQYGAGHRIPSEKIRHIQNEFDIRVDCFDYKATIQPDIASSDLVISHAGAGSCIEVLSAKKPLIVVVNNKLMDNHQTELAHQLHSDGHLLYCLPSTLIQTLCTLDQTIFTLKPYESADENMLKFINHLNSIMGFEPKS